MSPATIGVLVFLAVLSLALGLRGADQSALLDELAGTNEAPSEHLTQDAPLLVRIMATFSYSAVGRVSLLQWLVERAKEREADLDRVLAQAGYPWGLTSSDLVVITWGGAIAGGVVGIIVCLILHITWLFGAIVGVALGLLPRAMVRSRAKQRSSQIRRSLPAMLDLLIMAAQAGMTTSGGLNFVARELPGPLGDEIRYLTRQLSAAVDEVEAFVQLADRCQVDEVEEFAQALVTATKHSRMTYEQVLASQADRLRTAIEQEVEARVHKLTVQIVLPLVAFYLPAILLVVVGPSLSSLHGLL